MRLLVVGKAGEILEERKCDETLQMRLLVVSKAEEICGEAEEEAATTRKMIEVCGCWLKESGVEEANANSRKRAKKRESGEERV
jgi:hypothetical protein